MQGYPPEGNMIHLQEHNFSKISTNYISTNYDTVLMWFMTICKFSLLTIFFYGWDIRFDGVFKDESRYFRYLVINQLGTLFLQIK